MPEADSEFPMKSQPRIFPQRVGAYARALTGPLRDLDVRLLLEPGRSIVGPAGVLLTSVVYKKANNGKRFLVVDAAMNDLIRPALYGATTRSSRSLQRAEARTKPETADIVGPICETGDFFARDRQMPGVEEGELLAILDAGAYGMVLSLELQYASTRRRNTGTGNSTQGDSTARESL